MKRAIRMMTTTMILVLLAGCGWNAEAATLTPEPTEAARVQVACTASIEYPWGEVYVEYNRFDPAVEHHYWDESARGGSASMIGLDVQPCRVGDLYDLVLWPRAGDATWGVYDGWMRCSYGSNNYSAYQDDRWPSEIVSVAFLGFGPGCDAGGSGWVRVRIEQRTSSSGEAGRRRTVRR